MKIRPVKVISSILLSILSGLLISCSTGYAEDSISVSNRYEYIAAGDMCDILEDKNGHLTLDVVLSDLYAGQFKKSEKKTPNFGFTDSAYWVRIPLVNRTAKPSSIMLEIAFPHLDTVEFYLLDTAGGLLSYESSGRDYPFIKRSVGHRNFVFYIEIPKETSRICYLRIKSSDAVIFPINIWSPANFIKKIQIEKLFFGIYYGIILIMIFYNFFIFISTRDRNYLYYVLFIVFFGFFQFSMNGLAIEYIWKSTPWHGIHSIPFLIGLSCLFAGLFSIRFLSMKELSAKYNYMMHGLSAAGALLAFSSLFIDYSAAIITGQILPVLMIFVAIAASIEGLRSGNRFARYYLVAWAVFFAGVLLSAFRVSGTLPHNIITEYGLQVGSGIQMVLLSFALADRINLIEKENDIMQMRLIKEQEQQVENLNRSNRAIEEANTLLKLSEEKYRRIVEGSSDIIFTLDQDLNFINANHAIAQEFKIDPRYIAGASFLDLLYVNRLEQSMFGLLVKEKLDEFLEKKQPVYFRAQFSSSENMEPREMQVHMEYINIHGKYEILGKMSNIIDDSLLDCFVSECQKYRIGNMLVTADEITHRTTRNIKKYMDQADIRLIQIALREIIINAIEHGNLNITYEEKSAAIAENRYFQLIRERQSTPGLKEKRVTIEYMIDSESIRYIISDEGEGFKYSEYLDSSVNTDDGIMVPHGRGLSMTLNVFDEVQFNEKGNFITLIKYVKNKS